MVIYNLKDCCCRRCAYRFAAVSRRIGDALMPAFATFIILSYTKFSLTSTYLCTVVGFYEAKGNTTAERYSFYAGQFSANDLEFILHYYLPAIFVFLTFVAIPPLVLLDYPLRLFEKVLSKVPCLWRHYPKSKIHILLDAFQGCYKNKWRCFAGLYFIFRL